MLRCEMCGRLAQALLPQSADSEHRAYGVEYVPSCLGCAFGWTDPSEPQYGATTYRA